MTDLEITPAELDAMRREGKSHRLIDVREPYEVKIASVKGAEEIPMRSIPSSLPEFESETRPLIILCHHGVRSLQVVCWLREQGIDGCLSVAGGIEGWSLEIDRDVPRY